MLTINIEAERWIQGYEGLYSIDIDGNIWSYHNSKMKLKAHKSKYIEISLRKDGIDRRYKVHRLIANAFIPNPDHLPQINHIDGDKYNNKIDNLEWVTNADNMIHAYRTGLQTPSRPNRKRIGRYDIGGNLIEIFESVRSAVRAYGGGLLHVLYDNKSKQSGGFIWKFIDKDGVDIA